MFWHRRAAINYNGVGGIYPGYPGKTGMCGCWEEAREQRKRPFRQCVWHSLRSRDWHVLCLVYSLHLPRYTGRIMIFISNCKRTQKWRGKKPGFPSIDSLHRQWCSTPKQRIEQWVTMPDSWAQACFLNRFIKPVRGSKYQLGKRICDTSLILTRGKLVSIKGPESRELGQMAIFFSLILSLL